MNCCPSADFTFLPNGIQVSERNIQADEKTQQFFPFKNIQAVRYSYSRSDGGTITISVGPANTSYRYTYPCSEAGRVAYDKIVANIPA
jgi:hypothetical protein